MHQLVKCINLLLCADLLALSVTVYLYRFFALTAHALILFLRSVRLCAKSAAKFWGVPYIVSFFIERLLGSDPPDKNIISKLCHFKERLTWGRPWQSQCWHPFRVSRLRWRVRRLWALPQVSAEGHPPCKTWWIRRGGGRWTRTSRCNRWTLPGPRISHWQPCRPRTRRRFSLAA